MELGSLSESKKLNGNGNFTTDFRHMIVKTGEDTEKTTWKKAFANFCASTTFHGVGRIVEDTPFTLRRIIWVFLVLVGAGLFLMQLIGCIIYYRSWPVTVNVKINYADSVSFPAVTICNLNAFKMSKAASNDHYDIINDLYSSGGSSGHRILNDNCTIEDIFEQNAHSKEDMILSCQWNNENCSISDFEKILTDHGVCFTFNGGNKPIKTTAQTGAKHGLRLTINVEQYEYMTGPYDSAGFKVLLHEPNEVPMVRDLGQAIPPGSHAFVGMSIIKVENLVPPYGKCGSRKLKYYDYYSVPACDLDCEATHMVYQCDCRDFYMPEIYEGYPPVCNLSAYATCLRPTTESYERNEESCPCPVPCNRTLFDTTTTYSTISNFNTENWLRSDSLGSLQNNYINAREIRQKVDQNIRKADEAMVRDLLDKYEDISHFFDNMTRILEKVKSSTQNMTERMLPRIHYHWDRGLDKSVFIYHNDFIRGWDVMDERTFAHVTTGFFQTSDLFEHMLSVSQHQNTTQSNDTCSRQSLYHIIDANLMTKVSLAERARANLTEVYEAYIDGIPILSYKATPDRRYDMSYISLDLLHHDLDRTHEYFDFILRYTGLYIDALQNLRLVAKQIFENGTYDQTLYQTSIDSYVSMAKKFLYRRYVIYDRIVAKPTQILDEIVQKFNSCNETLHVAMADVIWPIDNLLEDIKTMQNSSLKTLRRSIDKANDYITHYNTSKTEVSLSFSSPTTEEELRNMNRFFTAARSRGRELLDGLRKFQAAYTAMWDNMLGEVILKNFYTMMHDDVLGAFSNSSNSIYLHNIVRRMLRYPRGSLDSVTKSELMVLTNADFLDVDIENKSVEVQTEVEKLMILGDLDSTLGSKDELFLSSFSQVKSDLEAFNRKNTIDASFFMENFLQLDVFLKELSFEEIKQQIAYDDNSLWGDIGGSLGLFVGASLISLFEFADFIIHTMLIKRRIGNKKRH